MINKIGNILKWVLIFIVIICFLIISYTYLCVNIMGNDYVNLFGYTYFEVGSGSMNPTITTGDIVIVKIKGKYRVDDIVTYKSKNNYVTHRVTSIDDEVIVTKGDANGIRDNVVSKGLVIGKVVLILKKAGIWRKTLFSKRVLVLFVITLILFVFTFSYDNKIIKYRMRKIRYKKKRRVRAKKGKKV